MPNRNEYPPDERPTGLTRRELMASGMVLAAASAATSPAMAGTSGQDSKADSSEAPRPPFDSMRDYVAALEAHGLLLRFSGIDQDKYDATAIMYRLVDSFGVYGAPAVLFDDITANGKKFAGPVVAGMPKRFCGTSNAPRTMQPSPIGRQRSSSSKKRKK